MTRKQKIVTGIIIGAAAGMAAAMFFETESGKKLLAKLKQLASESFDDALARLLKPENNFTEELIEETEDIDADEVLS